MREVRGGLMMLEWGKSSFVISQDQNVQRESKKKQNRDERQREKGLKYTQQSYDYSHSVITKTSKPHKVTEHFAVSCSSCMQI